MSESQRLRGTVVNWAADRGFGFLKPANAGPPLFFHVSAVESDTEDIEVGAECEFVEGISPRTNRPCAVGVKIV